MSLTPQQVKTLQEVLSKKGFLVGAGPSEQWTAQACNGYKHYQLHQGVQYPHCDLLPEGLHSLSKELRDAVTGVAPAVVVEEKKVEAAPVEVAPKPAKADTAIRIPKTRK